MGRRVAEDPSTGSSFQNKASLPVKMAQFEIHTLGERAFFSVLARIEVFFNAISLFEAFKRFELADGCSGWAAKPRQAGGATWSRPKRCVQNKVVAPVVVPVVIHVTHVTFMVHVPHVTSVSQLSLPFLFSADFCHIFQTIQFDISRVSLALPVSDQGNREMGDWTASDDYRLYGPLRHCQALQRCEKGEVAREGRDLLKEEHPARPDGHGVDHRGERDLGEKCQG